MLAMLTAAIVLAAALAPVVDSGHGFDWSAAGIGAAAGFGIALVLVGSVALLRAGRR